MQSIYKDRLDAKAHFQVSALPLCCWNLFLCLSVCFKFVLLSHLFPKYLTHWGEATDSEYSLCFVFKSVVNSFRSISPMGMNLKPL